MEAKRLKSHRSFGGNVEYYTHPSKVTNTDMRFTVFRPSASESKRVPVIFWLSGLTCTEENFTAKSGYQQFAEQYGFLVVAPDTSPRGAGIEGEDTDWDFGTGAGFYVDATNAPWDANYKMYSYVTEELTGLIHASFPTIPDHQSIMGHSMGGHGAMVIGLRNPEQFRSISAFSPICAPMQCPWGERAFTGYLGTDKSMWEKYDTTKLIVTAEKRLPLLVDQGSADPFLNEQLKPDLLKHACLDNDYPLDLRIRDGYDHSFFYISSFIGEHFAFHAQHI